MHQHVTEFAAFVYRAGRRYRYMAGNTARCGELAKQALHAALVLRHLRIDLGIAAFEIARTDQRRAAMARAGEIDDVLPSLLNQPAGMRIDESQPGTRSPVPQQPRLDVLWRQRFPQQSI